MNAVTPDWKRELDSRLKVFGGWRWENIAKTFGYLFFGLGLVLLALIIYAMVSRLAH